MKFQWKKLYYRVEEPGWAVPAIITFRSMPHEYRTRDLNPDIMDALDRIREGGIVAITETTETRYRRDLRIDLWLFQLDFTWHSAWMKPKSML